ncbi:unnamed protein product [Clonostachys rosea f. rosea IK726]|uniref:Uncharacterized protein n=1 Tax=Clonostachys rosea f. rosea IK726 TaxID=1349383 RepID=A0ACA9U2M3_BIOOC|nr:unnamed protein product [Clonostachys rosea f. rosea IK726]
MGVGLSVPASWRGEHYDDTDFRCVAPPDPIFQHLDCKKRIAPCFETLRKETFGEYSRGAEIKAHEQAPLRAFAGSRGHDELKVL